MPSGATDTRIAPGAPRVGAARAPVRARPGDASAVSAAIVLATAPGAGGGPAALLPWEDGTLLSRLLDQLAALGVGTIRVLTRPQWERDVRAAAGSRPVALEASPSVEADLRAVGAAAREGAGAMIVLAGEIVTHGEALAGLVKDPRVTTGVLLGGNHARRFAFRVRSKRGRVISAASAYHAVHNPTSAFLSVLKVAEADREALAGVAERMAALVASPPPEWQEELVRKGQMWRTALWRAAGTASVAAEQDGDGEDEPAEDYDDAADGADDVMPAQATLEPEDEGRVAERLAAAEQDAAALLVVGLVRDGVHVGVSRLRKLYWARPLAPDTVGLAAERIVGYDEDKVLLDSAVKGSDGFFTTHFVSPYSRYIARWAAHRGFTPNQVTTVSMLIGLIAAVCFATGERWGLIAGAVLLQASFTTDCVDGQLARYTRTFSKLGAWLDSIFDRTKEYLAFAGLAIGGTRLGESVWLLACCAITLQTARHSADFSFGAGQTQLIGLTEQPPLEQVRDVAGAAAAERRARAAAARQAGDVPAAAPRRTRPPLPRRVLRLWHVIDRLPGVRWVKKMIAFPIGERFAVVSITAALFTPRVTFIALLAWGGLAVVYTLTGRVLRSIAR